MLIIGIDPGYAILGYGVISYEGNKFDVIEYGTVTTSSDVELPNRLKKIYNELYDLFEKYKPDAVAIEELFFNKNVTTALMVAHARGVAVVAAAKAGLEIFEYTPLQVKQGVVGYGRAEKKQVQIMVKTILNLKEIPRPDDAADALAVGICHAHSGVMGKYFKIR
ncbi:MAG: crossover junction endodeoxyribonuclease RuvC [Peptostreptococcaceae bacterium]|nr:crossover junction endodeoxyribonuclease RuvC [Peptostreptococcaceae bacterium]